jgi:hypothetical protein
MELLPLWVWLGGVFLGLVYVGSRWDDTDWNHVGPFPVLAALFWPVTAPMLAGRTFARRARRRAERRAEIEAERKRWLEASF